MCLDKLFCFGLVWFCFSYFLQEVGPWVKLRLKGNLVSCLVSAAAILPDQCRDTLYVPFSPVALGEKQHTHPGASWANVQPRHLSASLGSGG